MHSIFSIDFHISNILILHQNVVAIPQSVEGDEKPEDSPVTSPEQKILPEPEEPLKIPLKKVNVRDHYRPNPREFRNDLNGMIGRLNSIQRAEPNICGRIRERLDQNVRLLRVRVETDLMNFLRVLPTSKSDERNEALSDIQKAHTQVQNDLTNISAEFLKKINDKCFQIGTFGTINDINKEIEKIRANQLDTSLKLSLIPQRYADVMQSNYVPVEQIIAPPTY